MMHTFNTLTSATPTCSLCGLSLMAFQTYAKHVKCYGEPADPLPAPYSVPAACQEPPQPDDYEQRRAQVAKRRNPQPQLLGWFWINESSVADHQVTTGIARAVERLNRPHGSFIEGAAQWHP